MDAFQLGLGCTHTRDDREAKCADHIHRTLCHDRVVVIEFHLIFAVASLADKAATGASTSSMASEKRISGEAIALVVLVGAPHRARFARGATAGAASCSTRKSTNARTRDVK